MAAFRMLQRADYIELSASDLGYFLACRHRTSLDLEVALGQRSPPTYVDPALALLQERGLEHERAYLTGLTEGGMSVHDLSGLPEQAAIDGSQAAMRAGIRAIAQPVLRDGQWVGRPDVLVRVDSPSALGDWSYEVVDTKLARSTGSHAVLQLVLYSELLGSFQALVPSRFHVVTTRPDRPVDTFRVDDFREYTRLVARQLVAAAKEPPRSLAEAHYPERVEHCDVCRWSTHCDRRRRSDDHLSLVAGMTRRHGAELATIGASTLELLGSLPVSMTAWPRRGAQETYARLQNQARVQLQGRRSEAPVHELLPLRPSQGLSRLPVPSPNDIFLDLEGDPFAPPDGREYLFGRVERTAAGDIMYEARWALSATEEAAAFEELVDTIVARRSTDPGMHVYHYAAYEPAALKRLMGRHGTRESEIDGLLRGGVFVDLLAVVKHSLRASVESYSIKNLEPFYGFQREAGLDRARVALRTAERAIELRAHELITDAVREAVEAYNRDDCASTLELRGWLETLRSDLEAGGTPVPRPSSPSAAAPETVAAREERSRRLRADLVVGVPSDAAERSPEQAARWLLGNLLEWHRREDRAPWWEYFRLRDLTETELLDERAAIAAMSHLERIGGTPKCPIDSYFYAHQDTDVRRGSDLQLQDGTSFGSVESIDRIQRIVTVKKKGAQAELHPSAVFTHTVVPSKEMADAISRLAEDVIAHGLGGGTRRSPARALLLREPPRLRVGAFAARDDESMTAFAVRIAPQLESTVLAIQARCAKLS